MPQNLYLRVHVVSALDRIQRVPQLVASLVGQGGIIEGVLASLDHKLGRQCDQEPAHLHQFFNDAVA